MKTADGLRASGTSFRMNPDRTGFLFNIGGDLGLALLRRPTGGAAHQERRPRRSTPRFSPDGKQIAFVRGGNLFAVDLETQTEQQLTTDGGGDILNGKADWVY